ncbi:hypothetical protein EDC04DRAFT_2230875 [Pisolithus marmoratus]|nr:hypothetical protein EDC04DRAFT_2230875 [Pisolithus marmoratus]
MLDKDRNVQQSRCMPSLHLKLGLNQLCDHAFAFIRENLNENNALQEVSCGFVGRFVCTSYMFLDLAPRDPRSPSETHRQEQVGAWSRYFNWPSHTDSSETLLVCAISTCRSSLDDLLCDDCPVDPTHPGFCIWYINPNYFPLPLRRHLCHRHSRFRPERRAIAFSTTEKRSNRLVC